MRWLWQTIPPDARHPGALPAGVSGPGPPEAPGIIRARPTGRRHRGRTRRAGRMPDTADNRRAVASCLVSLPQRRDNVSPDLGRRPLGIRERHFGAAMEQVRRHYHCRCHSRTRSEAGRGKESESGLGANRLCQESRSAAMLSSGPTMRGTACCGRRLRPGRRSAGPCRPWASESSAWAAWCESERTVGIEIVSSGARRRL
jgi:hypothetical protein